MKDDSYILVKHDEFMDMHKKAQLYEAIQASMKKRANHLNQISPEERSERARKAVKARWDKNKAQQ